MQADGFSLDDKRAPVSENDIPDIISRFHNLAAEADRERTDKSFLVPVSEIIANNFDLSVNKYKKTVYEAIEYPPTVEIMAKLYDLQAKISNGMEELNSLLEL